MGLSETVIDVNETEGRRRLGRAVAAERAHIFGTVDRARIVAGVARGTWDKVEAGEKVRDFSLASIEKALDWPAGRAAAIIRGEDPGQRVKIRAQVEEIDSALRQSVQDADLPAGIKRAMLALLDSVDDNGDDPPNGERHEGVKGA